MKYVVRCGVATGQSRTATINGVKYTWPGAFGLAPTWAAGSAIPLSEQQLITACLGAHVNKFGLNVSISVLGYDKNSVAIPPGSTEIKDYATREGCFFGNLFNGEGAMVGNDSVWGTPNSSSRECAITTKANGGASLCLPMVFTDDCKTLCTLNAAKTAYTRCTANGKSYLSITTRILSADVFSCGDGVCQVSEHCGTGTTPDNCKDCGPC